MNEKISLIHPICEIFSSLVKYKLRLYFINNKKGMYFTIMTIAFLFIFLFIFMVPSYKRLGEKMAVIEMRVNSMNDLIKGLERDTERGLYISSFRAILSLEEYIVENGKFLNDVESNFTEALLNGTISGINFTLMTASTFPLWIAKMEEEALNFNTQANITLHKVGIYQNDPWYVTVSVNLTFFIRDVTGVASWKFNKIIDTSVSIIPFEDPFYIKYTLGRTTNPIEKTPFENNYTYKVGNDWYVNNLLNHTENSLYSANTNAPDFLTRLEGRFDPSNNGIETLVNLVELAEKGLDICDTCSIVDHRYWADNPGNYRVNHTPSWFRLDNEHREKYNTTKISCEVTDLTCMSGLISS